MFITRLSRSGNNFLRSLIETIAFQLIASVSSSSWSEIKIFILPFRMFIFDTFFSFLTVDKNRLILNYRELNACSNKSALFREVTQQPSPRLTSLQIISSDFDDTRWHPSKALAVMGSSRHEFRTPSVRCVLCFK